MRFGILAALLLTAAASAQVPLYAPAPGLFDAARPDDLGLKPDPAVQTFTVFRGDKTDTYANDVALHAFQGRLYAQWQSSQKDEDSTDTHVVYAVSADGAQWSAPQELTGAGRSMTTSGGWWSDGTSLTAFINVWNSDFRTGGTARYRVSRDGVHWSKSRPVTGADGKPVPGVIEQDIHALPDGRLVTAFHVKPGLIATPFYTDDPTGRSGWRKGRMEHLPHEGLESRELEPSLFRRFDGCLVMVFRDQDNSFRQLASESCDRGQSWSKPALTAMRDARAKQSAGNLPDGTAYLVNTPSGNKLRSPLVASFSKDGRIFDRAILLRAGPPPEPRGAGLYKRAGYHYPKSAVFKGALYVGYASAKEDVEVTRLSGLH
jgi:hypothetical protein